MDVTDDAIHSGVVSNFDVDVIRDVLKNKFSNSKNKITDDSLELINELMKALVIETALRSGKMASKEESPVVDLRHVESILAQIMLDFP